MKNEEAESPGSRSTGYVDYFGGRIRAESLADALEPLYDMPTFRQVGQELVNATASGAIYRRIAAGIALEQMFHARRPRCQERCKALAPYAMDIRAFAKE